MRDKPVDERQKKIESITLWGLALNMILTILKIISGIMIKSSALIADGIHTLSDCGTDFVTLVGTRLSNRPPDSTHPFGHGKIETITSQLISVVLFAVSAGLIWSAGASIYSRQYNYPGFMVLVVAAISVISKEIIFFLTRRVSRVTHSPALYANAWHHRSDSLSSVAVLIGGIASLLGWGHADHMATLIVGFMIMGVAGKIFFKGLIELSEHSAGNASIQKIEKVLAEISDISDWHALRTRKVGAQLFIDVHVLVDPALSVQKSHEITTMIEERINMELSMPLNILIHVEPDMQKICK